MYAADDPRHTATAPGLAASSARLGPLVTSAVTAAAMSYASSVRSSPSRTILDWSRPASSRR